jgi:hypothetical protein
MIGTTNFFNSCMSGIILNRQSQIWSKHDIKKCPMDEVYIETYIPSFDQIIIYNYLPLFPVVIPLITHCHI